MNRAARAALGRETLAILERGSYPHAGRSVTIAADLARAIAATREVPPEEELPLPAPGERATATAVAEQSTLAGLRALEGPGCALNFASAKNPGGGFLSGASAQEESLARSSGLYACLRERRMYAANRKEPRRGVYQEFLLHSPAVPVFRDDVGTLLAEPWTASFITAPAVNAGVARRNGVPAAKILRTMQGRVARVLALAAGQGERHLVLGAWGCGVFRNPPEQIARLFAEALTGPFAGVFSEVRFAVLGASFRPFAAALRRHLPGLIEG